MSEKREKTRCTAVFAALAAAFCVVLVLNINAGSVRIPVADILRMFLRGEGSDTQMGIVFKIRLPRTLLAAILGGALALSGFLLQTFFGNPIAGPYVLGISSGAKMTVAMAMIVFLKYSSAPSSAVLIIAAFAGSAISLGFVLLLSKKVSHMSSLLVGGIMIGYICSAVTELLENFADDADIVNLHTWSMGSFGGRDWQDVLTAAVVVGAASVSAFLLSKPIGAYRLGEAKAVSLGVDIKRFRFELIFLSSLLSACVAAFAGPVSFVGVAVPHVIKKLLGTSRPIIVMPASFLGGAVFCMACDMIARTIVAPNELNISTVTAIFGAPVVIAIMLSRGGGA